VALGTAEKALRKSLLKGKRGRRYFCKKHRIWKRQTYMGFEHSGEKNKGDPKETFCGEGCGIRNGKRTWLL